MHRLWQITWRREPWFQTRGRRPVIAGLAMESCCTLDQPLPRLQYLESHWTRLRLWRMEHNLVAHSRQLPRWARRRVTCIRGTFRRPKCFSICWAAGAVLAVRSTTRIRRALVYICRIALDVLIHEAWIWFTRTRMALLDSGMVSNIGINAGAFNKDKFRCRSPWTRCHLGNALSAEPE